LMSACEQSAARSAGRRTPARSGVAAVQLLVGHKKDVRAVAYLPDGRLVSGGSDRTVRVWDLATQELVRTIKARTPVYAMAVAPDGRTIAYAGRHPGPDAGVVPIQTFRLAEGLPGFTYPCPYSGGRSVLPARLSRHSPVDLVAVVLRRRPHPRRRRPCHGRG
jgi:hypothetical protein